MEIKEIAHKMKMGLSHADTIIDCDEVSITDTDRIYISFTESIDAHEIKLQDLIRLDCSKEEYVFNKAEEYVNFLLKLMGVDAEVELDYVPINDSNELWVYGDIVID